MLYIANIFAQLILKVYGNNGIEKTFIKDFLLDKGRSTVVEHLPQYSKVKGLSPGPNVIKSFQSVIYEFL